MTVGAFYLLVLPSQESADLVNSWIFERAILVRQTNWNNLAQFLKDKGIQYKRVELKADLELDRAREWVNENQITDPVVVLREALDPVDFRIGWINR